VARYGFVISANSDRPTRALHPAATLASTLLTKAGLTVREYYGKGQANAARVYADLQEICLTGDSVEIAFIVAHGSSQGLLGSDGQPMFTAEMAPLLAGAIVVANSCLLDERLARAMSGELAPIAMIGYSPTLGVQIDSKTIRGRLRKIIGLDSMKNEELEAVLLPLKRIVEDGLSVRGAVVATKKAWSTMAAKLLDGGDRIISSAIQMNSSRMRSWGDASARWTLEGGVRTGEKVAR
jgi:hypothetical protein